MRVLINTFGSLGDVFPYLHIADHLTQSGHTITIAANDRHRARVEASGLEFRSIRPTISADAAFFRRVMSEFDGSRFLIKNVLAPAIRDSYADLKQALPGHDLLVTHPAAFAGPLLARQTGIPWVSTVLAPLGFFSATDPPVGNAIFLGLRRRAPRAMSFVNRQLQRSTRNWCAPVQSLREELGQLSAGNPLFEAQHSPSSVLALFSKYFAAPQPDWPANTTVTGFPFSAPEAMPPAIERFLAEGPPPIVFTLGSAAVFAPGSFFDLARSLGMRALLLAGPNAASVPTSPNVLAVEYAPHSAVFPHAAAIVHQAGIGTASEVLRSGRPSLVVPFAHDQPDNGARLERLGAARVLSRRSLTPKRLKRELEALLGNPDHASAANRLSEQVRSEDGAQTAALAISASLHSRM